MAQRRRDRAARGRRRPKLWIFGIIRLPILRLSAPVRPGAGFMSKVTLYSASAGTGKTYTICEEIASRIEKGLDPRRLLACTFTKKAAAELKSRAAVAFP